MRMAPKDEISKLSNKIPKSSFGYSTKAKDASTFPLLPLLKYWRVLGAIPFQEGHKGLTFSFISWPMIYCVLLTSLLLFLAHYTMVNSKFYYRFSLGFDQFIRSLVIQIYLGFVLLNPTTWPSSPTIVECINNWTVLQLKINLLESQPSKKSFLLDHPNYCILVVSAFAFLQIFLSFVTASEIKILVIMTFVFIVHNLIVSTWFWVVFPSLVSRKAHILKRSLIKTVLHGGRGEDVRRHRLLWEDLRTQTRTLSDTVTPRVTTWLLLRLLLIVLSMYATAVYTMRYHDYRVPPYILMPLLQSVFDLIVVCECCHRADLQLRQGFQRAILSCKFLPLPPDTQNELKLFLSSLERSEYVFCLQEIYELNRKTLLTISSLTLTYITILVQLKQLPLFNEHN